MMDFCHAKIRPMPDATEIECQRLGPHDQHRGVLRDYAYLGSTTEIVWLESDRRTFRGDWRPCTATEGCVLPGGHRGRCAQ